MLTGRHWVRDVYCKKCEEKLGWMYEFAMEEQQRYKESRCCFLFLFPRLTLVT
jgi:hypothetical protein